MWSLVRLCLCSALMKRNEVWPRQTMVLQVRAQRINVFGEHTKSWPSWLCWHVKHATFGGMDVDGLVDGFRRLKRRDDDVVSLLTYTNYLCARQANNHTPSLTQSKNKANKERIEVNEDDDDATKAHARWSSRNKRISSRNKRNSAVYCAIGR